MVVRECGKRVDIVKQMKYWHTVRQSYKTVEINSASNPGSNPAQPCSFLGDPRPATISQLHLPHWIVMRTKGEEELCAQP